MFALLDELISSLSSRGEGKTKRLTFVIESKVGKLAQKFSCAYADQLGLSDSRPVSSRSRSPKHLDVTIEGSLYEALYFTRAYMEVLLDRFPKLVILGHAAFLPVLLASASWPSAKFTKYAKYCTAYPMAFYLKNPLPVTPEGFPGSPLFSGYLKKLLKNRLLGRIRKSQSNLDVRLFFGILQGVKRACAPVSGSFVQQSLVDHRNSLDSLPRGSDPVLSLYGRALQSFSPPRPRLYEPSLSASYEAPRSLGGGRGLLQSTTFGPYRQLVEEGLVNMQGGLVSGLDRSFTAPVLPSFEEAIDVASRQPNTVMVHPILEPLKVRLITKGNTVRQWVAGHMQRALWDHLQKYPQFVLTGRTLDRFILSDLLERESRINSRLPPGLQTLFEFWVSGDYSAATDTLDIRHTKAVLEVAMLRPNWSEKHREVLRSVLYEQTIEYPRGAVGTFRQKTGQLMGSVLSFPVLCIVNLVTYWAALEEYTGIEFEMDDLPVLVNGDDILFRANDGFYNIWKGKASSAGFSLSLGKNYTHNRYFTVNSELWSCVQGNAETLRFLPFLNVGLLTGQSKITGRKDASLLPVWDLYNLVLRGSIDPVRSHRRFLHYHKDSIQLLTSRGRFNLAASKFKAGLGFESHLYPDLMASKWAPRFTRFQRQIAHLSKRAIQRETQSLRGIVLRSDTEGPLPGGMTPTRTRILPGPVIGPLPLHYHRKKTLEGPPILSQRIDPDRVDFGSPSDKIRMPYELLRRFRQATSKHVVVEDHDPSTSSMVPVYYTGPSALAIIDGVLGPIPEQ